jgi:hypothetical protein
MRSRVKSEGRVIFPPYFKLTFEKGVFKTRVCKAVFIPANLLRVLIGQLHSSLNGGSLPHGGMDELVPPAPPLGADTPLDPDPVLDVDPPLDVDTPLVP